MSGGAVALGTYPTLNNGFIQGESNDNYGAVAPLLINPNGGNVGLGGNLAPGVALEVQGSAATYTTGTEEEFKLFRAVTGGVSFPQAASFALGTYNNTGACCGPQSRLDIKLKSIAATDDITDVTAMSLLSNGNIGAGTSTPLANFSLQNNYGQSNSLLFNISSSTQLNGQNATSLFSISNTGFVGVASTSPWDSSR